MTVASGAGGNNIGGQLGTGNTTNSNVPLKVSLLTGIIDVEVLIFAAGFMFITYAQASSGHAFPQIPRIKEPTCNR